MLYRALDKLKKQIKAAKEEKKRLRELAALGIDPSTVPMKEKDGKNIHLMDSFRLFSD